MRWRRHPVSLAVYTGWSLLAAWVVCAATSDSWAENARPATTQDRRVSPVWGPQRHPVAVAARVARAPDTEQQPADGPDLIAAEGEVFDEPSPAPVMEPGSASPAFDGDAIEYPGLVIGPSSPGDDLLLHECLGWAVRNLQLFGGVHGFKGPTDLGRSGNFGFHEGVNLGAPVGDPWGYGYQVGFQALHSNFAGNQAVEEGPLPNFDTADRNQVFLTAGLFQRRMEGGLQGGVVFDLYYDNYYDKSTLYQIRSETALVLSELREIGYWGAYGLTKDKVSGFGQFDSVLDPTDVFAVFYRRHFTGGGHGRIWAGISGSGDAIFGLDGSVPLGTHWALDNNFTCLFPKHGRSADAPPDEAWSVSIHLVWYPGRRSNPVVANAYHPLFYVADNSWFLVDRRR